MDKDLIRKQTKNNESELDKNRIVKSDWRILLIIHMIHGGYR